MGGAGDPLLGKEGPGTTGYSLRGGECCQSPSPGVALAGAGVTFHDLEGEKNLLPAETHEKRPETAPVPTSRQNRLSAMQAGNASSPGVRVCWGRTALGAHSGTDTQAD